MQTHSWRSYAANHFECEHCDAMANNATGEWKFVGTNPNPKQCDGTKRRVPAEHRSWGKPAPSAWPVAAVAVDSDVKPPTAWPTATVTTKPVDKPATSWPTAPKTTGWPSQQAR